MENKETKVELEEMLPLEEIPKNNTNASLVETQNVEIDENNFQFIPDSIDDSLTPNMNVGIPQHIASENSQLISDQQYLSVINEIIENIRDDRKQISDFIDNMANMVINEGDATSASKEALVNLVKAKTDLQDKMLKAADLIFKTKSKAPANSVSALQQNNYNFGAETTDFSRRELIKALNQAKKKKDK